MADSAAAHRIVEPALRSYGEVSPYELLPMLLDRPYRKSLLNICTNAAEDAHFAVEVRFDDLFVAAPALAMQLGENPQYVLDVISKAIQVAELELVNAPRPADAPPGDITFKPHVHARVFQLPPLLYAAPGDKANPLRMTRPNISSIVPGDKGKFIQVSGTIIRAGPRNKVDREQTYVCKKCGYNFVVAVEVEHDNQPCLPTHCPSAGRQAQGGDDAIAGGAGSAETTGTMTTADGRPGRKSKKPKLCPATMKDFEKAKGVVQSDYQEVRLQERFATLALGAMPRSLMVILENDLTSMVRSGDDVTITGEVVHRWWYMSKGQRAVLEVALRANHVRVANAKSSISAAMTDTLHRDILDFWSYFHTTHPLRGRDAILRSVCPQLCGMYLPKLALMLILVGGKEANTEHGRIRGNCHMLLVGDPGTGKSQLMRYATKLVPRSVMTTGIGTTAAGLTAAVMRTAQGFTLDAGALVLADRGLCVIDEFGSMPEQDRESVLEAMEQETITLTKAGTNVQLSARATVICACNPKGAYNKYKSLSENTGISTPLLSRYDIVLVLDDPREELWSQRLSTFLLANAAHQGLARAQQIANTIDNLTRSKGRLTAEDCVRLGAVTPGSLRAPDGSEWASGHFAEAQAARFSVQFPEGAPLSFQELGTDMVGMQTRAEDGRRIEDLLEYETLVPLKGAAAEFRLRTRYKVAGPDWRWSLERLQAYVAYVKAQLKPVHTPAANHLLERYYTKRRMAASPDGDQQGTVTQRLANSLLRLSEAHARLLFRKQVLVQDAVIIIALLDAASLDDYGKMVESSRQPLVTTEFSPVPDDDYPALELTILTKVLGDPTVVTHMQEQSRAELEREKQWYLERIAKAAEAEGDAPSAPSPSPPPPPTPPPPAARGATATQLVRPDAASQTRPVSGPASSTTTAMPAAAKHPAQPSSQAGSSRPAAAPVVATPVAVARLTAAAPAPAFSSGGVEINASQPVTAIQPSAAQPAAPAVSAQRLNQLPIPAPATAKLVEQVRISASSASSVSIGVSGIGSNAAMHMQLSGGATAAALPAASRVTVPAAAAPMPIVLSAGSTAVSAASTASSPWGNYTFGDEDDDDEGPPAPLSAAAASSMGSAAPAALPTSLPPPPPLYVSKQALRANGSMLLNMSTSSSAPPQRLPLSAANTAFGAFGKPDWARQSLAPGFSPPVANNRQAAMQPQPQPLAPLLGSTSALSAAPAPFTSAHTGALGKDDDFFAPV